MTEQIKNRIAEIKQGKVPDGYKKVSDSTILEDYVETTFGELFDFYGGLGIPRNELGNEGIPYLHYGDMHRHYFSKVTIDQYKELPKYDIKISGKETFLLKDGDVVFLDASEDIEGTSRCVMVENPENAPFVSGLHTFIAREKQDTLTKDYKQYITTPDYVKKQFMKLASGFKVYGLNRNSIKGIVFAYPQDKREQQKIAEILMKWDEAIILQEKLIEKLEVQKKALMQRLLKPKDDWDKATLGEVLTESTEKTDFIGQYQVVSSTKEGLLLQSEYFDKEVASQDNIGYKVIRLNQIILSPQNLWMGNINYNERFDIGMVSPSYKVFSINKGFNSKFISTIMLSPKMFDEYSNISEQGASIVRRNLSIDLFKKIEICVPDITSQNHIASVISCFEKGITVQKQYLLDLKLQQKSLMQLLLTGIVRV